MTAHPVIVLGTHNLKKREELLDLLSPLGVRLQTLNDYPDAIEVVEDGETFAANAAKKATEQATTIDRWVLAEDSGLCVDALGGEPGVYSARFAGPHASDEENNKLLLERLADTPAPRRTAYYVCHVVIADPAGEVRAQAECKCRGRIIFHPVGSEGFGYDPLFEIPEYHRTFGQLGLAVKACLSHRSRALRRIAPEVRRLFDL